MSLSSLSPISISTFHEKKLSALRENFRTYRRFHPSSENPSFPCLKRSDDLAEMRNDQIVVRAEYKRKDGQVTRDFFVADPLTLLTDVMLKESFRDYHEIFLESRPMKFFFDIDAGPEAGVLCDPANCHALVVNLIVQACLFLEGKTGHSAEVFHRGVRIFSSSSNEKQSYHIIFSNLMIDPILWEGKMTAMPVLLYFFDEIFKCVVAANPQYDPTLLAKIIDRGPYASGKSLRMPYSYKGGKRRLLWMAPGDPDSLKPSDDVDAFLAGLISFDHGGVEIRYTSMEKGFERKSPRSSLHTKEREDIIGAILAHLGNVVQPRNDESKGYITFDRKNRDELYECPACGAVHESDNFYAFLRNGEIIVGCFRSGTKKAMGHVREISPDDRKEIEGVFSWEHSKEELAALLEAAEAGPNAVCDDCNQHLCECEDLLEDQLEYDLPRPLPLIVGEAPRLIAAREPPLPLFKIDMNDPYAVHDFCCEYMGKTFRYNTEEEYHQDLYGKFIPNLHRVFAYLQGGQLVIKDHAKDDSLELCYYGKNGYKMLRDYPQRSNVIIGETSFSLTFKSYFQEGRDDFFAIETKELQIPGWSRPPGYNVICTTPILKARYLGRYDREKIKHTLRFIHDVIAAGNDEYAKFVLTFLARPLRHNVRAGVSLIIGGKSDRGKSTLFKAISERIYGGSLSIPEARLDKITKQFNQVLDGKRLIVVNELPTVQKRNGSVYDALKSLITEDTFMMEIKGGDDCSVTNYMDFVFITNHKYAVPSDEAFRRRLAETWIDGDVDISIFEAFETEMIKPEWPDHFLTYLLTSDEFYVPTNPLERLKPPKTAFREEIIERSVSHKVTFENALFREEENCLLHTTDVLVRDGKVYVRQDELRDMISSVIGKDIGKTAKLGTYLAGEGQPVFLLTPVRMSVNGLRTYYYEISSEHYDQLHVMDDIHGRIPVRSLVEREIASGDTRFLDRR